MTRDGRTRRNRSSSAEHDSVAGQLILPAFVLDIPPKETVFWSGAGISAEAPTSAPLGLRLTSRALEYGFLPETADLLACYYRALRIRRATPRLETVLDVVFRVHGPAALVDLLSDVRDAVPNGLHHFLASAARSGSRQITTNFDDCLEQSGAQSVIHVHGSFAGDPSGASLGATLARVERGLPPAVREEINDALLGTETRLLVFAGYSGSDFFDVDPYLRGLSSSELSGKVIVWIEHNTSERAEIAAGEAASTRRRQLAWFADAGARTVLLNGATSGVLGALADSWSISPPSLSSLNEASQAPWSPADRPNEEARRRASLELYLLMGLHREVDRMLATRPPSDAGEWNALAHTRWSQGRNTEALDAWRRALVGFPLWEREAAVNWIRGRYRCARQQARTAVNRADASLGTELEVPFEERLVAAETLARLWQHMRRFPDSRLFATKRLRQFALDHLPNPTALAEEGNALGTHLASRIRSARASLGASSQGEWNAIESFGEYEALSASLNYQHGQLRSDTERGPVPAERYQLLYQDRITIGDTSAATRVMLLPGADAVFSRHQVVLSLRVIDMTRWHRLRFLTVDAARRTRARLR